MKNSNKQTRSVEELEGILAKKEMELEEERERVRALRTGLMIYDDKISRIVNAALTLFGVIDGIEEEIDRWHEDSVGVSMEVSFEAYWGSVERLLKDILVLAHGRWNVGISVNDEGMASAEKIGTDQYFSPFFFKDKGVVSGVRTNITRVERMSTVATSMMNSVTIDKAGGLLVDDLIAKMREEVGDNLDIGINPDVLSDCKCSHCLTRAGFVSKVLLNLDLLAQSFVVTIDSSDSDSWHLVRDSYVSDFIPVMKNIAMGMLNWSLRDIKLMTASSESLTSVLRSYEGRVLSELTMAGILKSICTVPLDREGFLKAMDEAKRKVSGDGGTGSGFDA